VTCVICKLSAAFCLRSFDIYGFHEFNSTRKRMAVVARGPDGRYLLLVKVRAALAVVFSSCVHECAAFAMYLQGADNVIFDRAVTEVDRPLLESQLSLFASTGLRTLVLAQRELSPQEFTAWKAEYEAAAVSLERRDEKLAAVRESVTDTHF
jgi:magnesium-transporting ATPase (P-type)